MTEFFRHRSGTEASRNDLIEETVRLLETNSRLLENIAYRLAGEIHTHVTGDIIALAAQTDRLKVSLAAEIPPSLH